MATQKSDAHRDGGGKFAEKLNRLFETVTSDDGRPYSNDQAASAISAGGVSITGSYIWYLRKGKKRNPTLDHIAALAKFFRVPTAYLVDDTVDDPVDRRLADLDAAQGRLAELAGNNEVQLMAMRAGGLSDKRRRQVAEFVDVVYQLEQAERASRDDPADPDLR